VDEQTSYHASNAEQYQTTSFFETFSVMQYVKVSDRQKNARIKVRANPMFRERLEETGSI
jgi:hypothetical protein